MRTAHVLATLACLAPLAQDDEPSFEQEVAALVERTNALESFRLVYDVEKTSADETKEGTLELLYLAPGFGRARSSGPSGEMDYWMVGDDVYAYMSETGWKSARVHQPAVCSVLDDRFPLADASQSLFFSLDVQPDDGDLSTLVQVGRGFSTRYFLLAWLRTLRSVSDVVREKDAFVWSSDGVSKRVSRHTGLLEELELESDGKHLRIHLRSAELDIELPAELLEPPREALGLPEDLELACQLVQIPADTMRRVAFERADQWLTRTKSTFDERARASWTEVLDALHRPSFEAFHSRMDADVGAKIAEAAAHLREERASDPSAERLATLKEELGKSRANLEAMLAKVLEKQLEYLVLPGSVSRDALLEVEQELFPVLWDELVAAPILARHDEELGAALER